MTLLGPVTFSNGLNTSANVFALPPAATTVQQGYRYIQGSLSEIFAQGNFVTGLGTTGLVQGIIPNPLGGTYAFLTVVDGKIYGVTNSGSATDISGTAAYGSGTDLQTNNGEVLNGIMVISDALGLAGQMNQWNGTGNVTVLTGSPDGTIVRVCNNFMFTFINSIAGSQTSTLYWSAVGDPTTWPAGNNLTFRIKDGSVIQDIRAIGSDLYIFKNKSIGRLSTQTIVISGAVALGPLVEVSSSVGISGPDTIAKLPDGRLVLLGTDMHAYVFDGSVLTDISDQPYPATNVQALLYALEPGTIQYNHVCAYPPRNEVWFILTKGIASLPFGNYVLIWNYKDNTWSSIALDNVTSTNRITQIAYIENRLNNGAIYSNEGSLMTGNRPGVILSQDIPNTGAASWNNQWSTSVSLYSDGRVVIPRSIIFFYRATFPAENFTISYGFDGGTIGNATTVIVAGSAFVRKVIPIVLPSTGQSSVGPSTFQIQIDSTSPGLEMAPFYLSDEIFI